MLFIVTYCYFYLRTSSHADANTHTHTHLPTVVIENIGGGPVLRLLAQHSVYKLGSTSEERLPAHSFKTWKNYQGL